MTSPYHDEYDYLFKIVLVGDSGVGKSSIVTRIAKDTFSMDTLSTIGVEFVNKSFEINNRVVKAQIWDTAGAERFRSVTSQYYRGVVGALVCYDITKLSSFQNVNTWLTDLQTHADDDIKIMIVGNKCDLTKQRKVLVTEATEYAKQRNLSFMETSALDNTNIKSAFEQILGQIFEIHSKKELAKSMIKSVSLSGGTSIETKKNAGCC